MLLVNYSNSGNLDLQVKIEIRQITSEINAASSKWYNIYSEVDESQLDARAMCSIY